MGRHEVSSREQSRPSTIEYRFPPYVPVQVQSIMAKTGWSGGGLGRDENGIRSVERLLEGAKRGRTCGLGYEKEDVGRPRQGKSAKRSAVQGLRWVAPSTPVTTTTTSSKTSGLDFTELQPLACDNYTVSAQEMLCVLPALAAFRRVPFDSQGKMKIIEPFRPGQAAIHAWTSLGHTCDSTPCHELGPDTNLRAGVLATFPTTRARQALMRSGYLRARTEWAILVPTEFTESISFGGVNRDELVVIHVRRRLVATWGTNTRSLYLSWVVRGAQFIHDELYTENGFKFYTADASQVLYPFELAEERGAADNAVGCRDSTVDLQGQARQARVYGLRPIHEIMGFAAVAGVDSTTDELDARVVCLQSVLRHIKEKGDHTTRPMLVSIVDEWARAFQDGQPDPYPDKLLRATVRLVKQGIPRMEPSQSVSALRSLAAAMSSNVMPDTLVRDVLHVASALVPIAGETAVCVRMAVTAMLAAGDKNKKAFKAARHCLATCLSQKPRETLVSILGSLASHEGAFSEKARYYMASVLKKQSAAEALSGLDGYSAVMRTLEPTSSTPTGNLVWTAGQFTAQSVKRPAEELSILTWNIDGLHARSSEVLDVLKERSPSVAVFCETKQPAGEIESNAHLRKALSTMGYDHVYATSCTHEPAGSWCYGVMVVSKYKPCSYDFGTGHDELDREGRCVTVRFSSCTLVGGYTPCSKPGAVPLRRQAYDASMTQFLLREKARAPGGRLIYTGDFNVTTGASGVEASADVNVNTTPGCMEGERLAFSSLKQRVGLVDTYALAHPRPSTSDFTWRARGAAPKINGLRAPTRMRLDYTLVTEVMESLTTRCDTLPFKSSDHCPVLYESSVRLGDDSMAVDHDGDPFREPPAEGQPATDYGPTAETQAVFRAACACLHGNSRQTEGDVADLTRTVDATNEARSAPGATTDDHGARRGLTSEDGARNDNTARRGLATAATIDTERENDVVRREAPWVPLKKECPVITTQLPLASPTGRVLTPIKALVDSGSTYNLLSGSLARRLHCEDISTNASERPRLTMANGVVTTPERMVRVEVGVGDTAYSTDFWVMPTGAYDIIIGSDFLHDNKGDVMYSERVVRMRTRTGHVDCPFESPDQRSAPAAAAYEAAAPMYATDNIVVRAGRQHFVPVATSKHSHVPDHTWGFVETSRSMLACSLVCAKGVTTLARTGNWVQIYNPGVENLVIRRGKHIADFHRQDKQMWEVKKWDIDVEDRVANFETPDWAADVSQPDLAAASTDAPEMDADWNKVENAFADPESKLHEITFGASVTEDEASLKQLKRLIYRFKHLWDKSDFSETGPTAKHDTTCTIDLDGAFTGKPRVRGVTPAVREAIKEQVLSDRKAGVIEPSASPYASTVLLVPKPDGTMRFCIDYRALNKVTKKDGYLMPRVDDSLSALNGAQYFTSLDLTSAFNQIPMDEESKDLTSFSTTEGTFRYKRMPFGLVNGPAVFHRFIDNVMSGLKWNVCLVYMDDVLIYSNTAGEHMKAVETVFQRIHDYGLNFKAKKCFVGMDEVKFLGHVVGRSGVKPDPSKTKAISDMALPSSLDDMRSALGLFSYYRKFCKGFSSIAKPIHDALKKGSGVQKKNGSVQWPDEVKESFEELRRMLLSKPLLEHPDWSTPFSVHTDWCKNGIGATLTQKVDGTERVVCYASRSLKEHESKYSAHEGECLAVIWATQLWYSMYLYGRKFTVVTDNEALTWLLTKTDTRGRLQRWLIMLQDLDFEAKHRKGSQHGDADGLSRNPLKTTNPNGDVDDVEPLHGSAPPIACAAGVQKPQGASFFAPGDEEAWSNDDWRRLQEKDEDCKAIRSTLDRVQAAAGSPSQKGPGSRGTKRTWGVQDRYTVIEGVLHVVPGAVDGEPGSGSPKSLRGARRRRGEIERRKPRKVVPATLRAFVLGSFHGQALIGHQGRARTYREMSQAFYWKGMYKDVKRWIRACTHCARRKVPRPTNAGCPSTVTSPFPFHTVCVDLVGPLPETSRGHKWALTISDRFTRWPIVVPLRSAKAPDICHALFSHLLAVHGCPYRILSDRGQNLIGKAVQHLCARWGIRKIQTTGHQPQANPVERFHSYLNAAMTALHGRFGMDWDLYVDAAVFAYRATINEATGFSPFFLLYGRECLLPLPIIQSACPEQEFDSEQQYATHVSSALAAAYQEARSTQSKAAAKNVAYRAATAKQVDFFPGQRVFYWQPGSSSAEQVAEGERGHLADVLYNDENTDDEDASGGLLRDGRKVARRVRTLPGKWTYKWTGPHVVVRRHVVHGKATNVYVVSLRGSNKEVKVNVNRLSQFQPWSDALETTSTVTDDQPARGGRPEVGDLFAFPLDSEELPFAVGKLLARNSNDTLHFQWMSNATDNMTAPLQPGWRDRRDNKVVYAARPPAYARKNYEALDDTHYDMGKQITDEDIIVHGFQLDKRRRIQADVLKALSDSDLVNWRVPEAGDGPGPGGTQ